MLQLLNDILARSASREAMAWLGDELAAIEGGEFNQRRFYYAFSGVSRRFDKAGGLEIAGEDLARLAKERPGFTVAGWDQFRLARVILLLALGRRPAAAWQGTLEAVLGSADLREQVAVFSAFPLLPDPGFLVPLAREGSRTNIVDVFDAIALDNPFPAAHFPEEAWNQLVLKALFISRPLYRVQGLEGRANPALAAALSNLARERWAAGRMVSPELWRSCAGQVSDAIAEDLARVAASAEPGQREAAALVAAADPDDRLQPLREDLAGLLAEIRAGGLTWDSLGRRLHASGAAA